jgi:hypothetical protein
MNFKEFYAKRHNIRPARGGELYVFYGPTGIIKSTTGVVKIHAHNTKQAVFVLKKLAPTYKFLRVTAQLYTRYLELKRMNEPKVLTPIQQDVKQATEKQLNLDI